MSASKIESPTGHPATGSMAGRLWRYVVEMYPLHVNVPYSFMSYFGYFLLLGALFGGRTLVVTPEALMGALTLAAFTLLLRVFDEFKDYEHDVRLFPHRPLPSGRVKHRDLILLAWALVALMVGLNGAIGGIGLAGFALLLGFGLLMLKFFFLPELHRRSLLLTLLTHNPVAIVSQLYILATYLQICGQPLSAVPATAWAAIVMLWMPVLAWETARKIRAPEQEDDYVTYSRIFGTRRAPLVPMMAIGVSSALALWLGSVARLGYIYDAVVMGAAAFSVGGLGRFSVRPIPSFSKLRPFAEAYGLALYVAMIAALIATRGVAWKT